MTLTINLSDQLFAKLKIYAEQAGKRPETVVEDMLQKACEPASSDELFRRAKEAAFLKHDEALARLAK